MRKDDFVSAHVQSKVVQLFDVRVLAVLSRSKDTFAKLALIIV